MLTHSEPIKPTHLTANPTKWLEEHDALLKERVAEGKHSYSEIAAELNATFGTAYSRNAVIGRANRLDISNKRPDQNVRPARAPSAKPRPKLRIVRSSVNPSTYKVIQSAVADIGRLLRVIPLAPLNLTLADLPANGCRYIAGDDFLFCGHECREGSSFCVGHHQIVWIPPTARNRAARGVR